MGWYPCCCGTCVTAVCATAAADATIYSGSTWTNPSDTAVNNSTFGSYSDTFFQFVSDAIKSTNFGFAIPAGATVSSLYFRWYGRDTSGTSDVNEDSGLFKPGPALIIAGAYQPTRKPTSPVQSGMTLGTSNGLTSWYGEMSGWSGSLTGADVNNTGFGVAWVFDGTPTGTVYIDYVECEVCY